MPLAHIEELLKHTIGLDAASIGSLAIERAVQERISVCAVSDSGAYWERVRVCETELQELIEAVVVPETWFFRNPESFAALARVVRDQCLPAHPERPVRLLSLPCSTGEEPYSMAMALFDAAVAPQRFRIDAVDVSAHALTRAGSAVYGRNSFRGTELTFRDRHFESATDGYRLADAVRRQVRFHRGNLLSPGLLHDADPYDVVFCRNVLIYFDRPTQDRAITTLARLLTAEGVLFTGASEIAVLMNHAFVSAKVPSAFAVRKAATPPREPRPVPAPRVACPSSRRAPVSPAPAPARTRASGGDPALAAPRRPANRAPAAPAVRLEEAVRLADHGRLSEAATVCAAHVRAHGPSAQAFHLLGLVRDAAGDHLEASRCYRKALYLDPHHYDALIHLAFLLEGQGNAEGARVLRRRAQRLEQASQH